MPSALTFALALFFAFSFFAFFALLFRLFVAASSSSDDKSEESSELPELELSEDESSLSLLLSSSTFLDCLLAFFLAFLGCFLQVHRLVLEFVGFESLDVDGPSGFSGLTSSLAFEPSDSEAFPSCFEVVLSVVSSILAALTPPIFESLELEDLVGVSEGVKLGVVGLTEVLVEGFQEEGVTGCLAASLSLGIIRSESDDDKD